MNSKFSSLLQRLNTKYDWFSLTTPQHSITNTELFYIYCYIESIKPTLIFESGVYRGRSTIILAEMMRDYGNVISACFHYPDEKDITLFPFVKDYANLNIVHEKGENIVQNLPDSKMVSIIDGPKPAGENWGRPGWKELMTNLMKYKPIAVFQHDVSALNPRRVFDEFCSQYPDYKSYLIDQDFLNSNTFYETPTLKPNLGVLKLKSSIS